MYNTNSQSVMGVQEESPGSATLLARKLAQRNSLQQDMDLVALSSEACFFYIVSQTSVLCRYLLCAQFCQGKEHLLK